MSIRSEDEKFNTILKKNSYFLPNQEFSKHYENVEIKNKIELLLKLKNNISKNQFTKQLLVEFIQKNSDGLECIFVLTSLSRETFLRIITLVRITKNPHLEKLLNWESWPQEDFKKEWTIKKINNLVENDEKIAEGVVNLFCDGYKNKILEKSIDLFERKKLSIKKISFSIENILDSLIRYKLKGSLSGLKEKNPETIIEKIFEKNKILWTAGEIKSVQRRMDFIIPSKENPEVLIEVSKLITTSSGMGDKAKTEQGVSNQIKSNYPNCDFIGFTDGIGWFVRQGDLKLMVKANDDSFTFDPDEIIRFEQYLKTKLSKNCYDQQ